MALSEARIQELVKEGKMTIVNGHPVALEYEAEDDGQDLPALRTRPMTLSEAVKYRTPPQGKDPVNYDARELRGRKYVSPEDRAEADRLKALRDRPQQ